MHTPYEGMVSEESKIGTTVFKWIHVEDLDKVGEPLEVRCESFSQVIYFKIYIITYDTNIRYTLTWSAAVASIKYKHFSILLMLVLFNRHYNTQIMQIN